MEIRRLLYYVVNCALVCYIAAKPFSLNKLIESESNQKEVIHTTLSPRIRESESAAERFSLNKGLKPTNRIANKLKETGTSINLIPLGKKISPLKYRKTFQIKSPLKPKRVKTSLRTRHKRKNQSLKREIDGNAILNKKYVPLLRSLGMLFDNILGADSGESIEKTRPKKRLRYYIDENDDVSCQCPRQRDESNELESQEKTIPFSKAFATEVTVTTEVAAETANNPSASNIRSFRHHKNVPLLLPRNTSGTRRNNHGIGERDRAAHNWSPERDISGNNGDSEHNPERKQEQSNAESHEEYTDSDSRNSASRFRTQGTVRRREYRGRNNTKEIYENGTISQETENFLESREDSAQHNGSHKYEVERDKAKSGKLLSEPVRGQTGFISNDNVVDFAESVGSEENDKESVISIALDSTGDQRFVDGDGLYSSENKKANARPEAEVIHASFETTTFEKLIKENDTSDLMDDYDDNDLNFTYDNQGSAETDNENSTDPEHTNARSQAKSESVGKQLHDISKRMKYKTLIINSSEIFTNNKEENGSMEHSSNHFDADSTYITIKHTSVRPDTVYKASSVENSQYASTPKTSKNRGPVVMIIDGYSVTRHKNGENKLSGKAIRIRP